MSSANQSQRGCGCAFFFILGVNALLAGVISSVVAQGDEQLGTIVFMIVSIALPIIGGILFFWLQKKEEKANLARLAAERERATLEAQHEQVFYAGYKLVAAYGTSRLYVDEANKRFGFARQIYQFDGLLRAELIENGSVITFTETKKDVSLKKALVGNALFGSTGAIIGGMAGDEHSVSHNAEFCDRLQIKLILNDLAQPLVYIPIVEHQLAKNTADYQQAYAAAEQFVAIFEYILHHQN